MHLLQHAAQISWQTPQRAHCIQLPSIWSRTIQIIQIIQPYWAKDAKSDCRWEGLECQGKVRQAESPLGPRALPTNQRQQTQAKAWTMPWELTGYRVLPVQRTARTGQIGIGTTDARAAKRSCAWSNQAGGWHVSRCDLLWLTVLAVDMHCLSMQWQWIQEKRENTLKFKRTHTHIFAWK